MSPTPSTQNTRDLLAKAASSLGEKDQLIEQFQTALREREDELNNVQSERNTLLRKLADVTNTAPTRRRGDADGPSDNEEDAPPRKKTAADVNGSAHAPTRKLGEDVTQAGRKFAIIGTPWLPLVASDFFQLDLDPEYNPKKRFDSEDNRIQGVLHDVHKMLPADLHPYMKEPWFAKKFHKAMRQQTSNTVHRVRSDLAEVLFGNEAGHLLDQQARFREFCVRIGYRNSQNPPKYMALDCPIIHGSFDPQQEKDYDPQDAFRNFLLILIFVGIIRGMSACRVTKQANGPTSFVPRGEYMQAIHHLDHTTVGSIALAALLLRWALSEDQELKAVGGQTGIKWQEDFDDYVRVLQKGLDDRRPSVRALFRHWDRVVYNQTHSRYGGGSAAEPDQRQSAIDAALGTMAEEEPEPESEPEPEPEP